MALHAGTAYVDVVPDLTGFSRSLDSALSRTTSGVGQKLSGVGKSLSLGVTLPLGLAAVKAVSLAGEFEQTMNTMAAVAGVPGPQIEKLRQQALKLGADTVFSANEAAQAQLELSKAGISTADIMGGALKNTLDLAAAGDLELAEASTIAARAMNTFSLSGEESKQAVDALAGAANASSASVDTIAQALAQGGQAAAAAGLSIQETTAILGAFADKGLVGSDAGTSLKTMLLNLIPTTDRAKAAMEHYGVSFADANGEMLSGLEIAQVLQDRLGSLSQAEQQTALKVMFGTDAFRASNVLMNLGAKGLSKYQEETSKVGNAAEVAKARMQGWAGTVETLKGSLETVGLVVGEFLIPPLTVLGKLVTVVANTFLGMPGPLKAVVVTLGGVAAAAGPVLWISGKIITSWRTMQTVALTLRAALAVLDTHMIANSASAGFASAAMTRYGISTTGVAAATGLLTKALKAAPWILVAFGIKEALGWLDKYNESQVEAGNTAATIGEKLEQEFDINPIGLSGDLFPAFNEGADKVKEKAKSMGGAVKKAMDASAESFAKFAKKAEETKQAVIVFAGMTRKEFLDWRLSTAENFNLVGGALDKLADKHKVTADQIIKQLQRTLMAQLNFGENWEKVVKRAGADGEDFVVHLQEQYGARAPALIAALAESNDKQFNKIVNLWQRSQVEAGRTADAVANIGDKSHKLGRDFDKVTSGIIGNLHRQRGGFQDWAEKSSNSINGVLSDWQLMKRGVEAGLSPQLIRAQGAGLPIPGGAGGSAARMAQTVMAAVPGPQYISSGYRPGDDGYHGDARNPAQDISGAQSGGVFLAGDAIFRAAIGTFGASIREAIWGHTRWEGGRANYWAPNDHWDHVHLADKGGVFKGPGMVGIGGIKETVFQPAEKIGDLPSGSTMVNHFHQVKVLPGDIVRDLDWLAKTRAW